MADKVTYEDLFDAKLQAEIDKLKVKVDDTYESFKRMTLEQAKVQVVTKETAKANTELAKSQAILLQAEQKSAKAQAELIILENKRLQGEIKLEQQARKNQTEIQKQIDKEAKLANAIDKTSTAYLKLQAEEKKELDQKKALVNVLNTEYGSRQRSASVISLLENKIKSLNLNTEDGKRKLEVWNKTIDIHNQKLIQTGSQMDKQRRNIGNYAYNVNGLNMSFNQISREMPAFANSVSTGFMAISNNIPMFVDEINKMRMASKALNEEGMKGPSVWKQLGSALLSWQTLLSVGITLLTVYGKDIVNWIGSLFDATDAIKPLTEAQIEHNRVQKEYNEILKKRAELQGNLQKAKDVGAITEFMTPEELEAFKTNVKEKIKTEREFGLSLAEEGRRRLRNDEEVQRIQKQIDKETVEWKLANLYNQLDNRQDFVLKDIGIQLDAHNERMKQLEQQEKEVDAKLKTTSRKKTNTQKQDAEESLRIQKELEISRAKLAEESNVYLFDLEQEWDLKILNYRKQTNKINEDEYETHLNNLKIARREFLNENFSQESQPTGGTLVNTTPTPEMIQTNSGVKPKDKEGKKDHSLLGMLGLDEGQKEIVGLVGNQFDDLINQQAEYTEKLVEMAERRTKAAQTEVDKQKELKEKGLAYSITAAEKELKASQEAQKKAEKQQKKALMLQQIMQGAEQASNLVTASSKIYAQVGNPILAIPLIALLWTLFGAAKVQAYKASKVTFGKGGQGVVGGGTHASGNDTFIGMSSNGERMYAEKDERWAIFNRRATAKYKNLLPTLINGANKLSLEKMIGSKANIMYNFNTSGIEGGLKKIERNTSEKVWQVNGRTYVKRGNITNIYV